MINEKAASATLQHKEKHKESRKADRFEARILLGADNLRTQKLNEHSEYVQYGLATMLSGMDHAIRTLQQELEKMRADLAGMQFGAPLAKAATVRGRKNDITTTRSGWSDDPEERKREMARRVAKHRAKTGNEATHPRDARHPDHAKWVAKMRRAQRKRWAGMTTTEREDQLVKMLAARGRKMTRGKKNGELKVAA